MYSGVIRPHFHHKGDSIIKKAVSQLYVQSGHSWQPASHVVVYIHWPYSKHACMCGNDVLSHILKLANSWRRVVSFNP